MKAHKALAAFEMLPRNEPKKTGMQSHNACSGTICCLSRKKYKINESFVFSIHNFEQLLLTTDHGQRLPS